MLVDQQQQQQQQQEQQQQMSFPLYTIQSDWSEVFAHGRKEAIWMSARVCGETKSKNYTLKVFNHSIVPEDGIDEFVVINCTNRCFAIEDKIFKVIHRFLSPIKSFTSIHSKAVNSLDVAPSGIAISSSNDNTLKVWDTQGGQRKHILDGHFLDVNKCRFFPSNEVILSAGSDMQLKIWSAIDGRCAATLRGHKGGVNDIAIVDRGRNIISVGQDGLVKLWSCGKRQCIEDLFDLSREDEHQGQQSLSINVCAIQSMEDFDLGNRTDAVHEDSVGTQNKLLLIGTESGLLYAIGVHSKKIIAKVKYNCAINCVTFCQKFIFAFGTQDGRIFEYDLRNPNVAQRDWSFSRSPALSMLAVKRPYDGLVIGRQDGTVNYVITDDRKQIIELTGADCDPIYDLSYDDQFVYTACRDGKVRKYRLDDAFR